MKSLAKTKKMGKFADGGEVEEESPSTTSESSSSESAAPAAEPAKAGYKSFKEAFAAERKSGAKTFEYMGKKYTTELASPRKEAAPAAPARKTESLSQGLGRKYAALEGAASRMPAETSSIARTALTKARDDAKGAYEHAANAERTGRSVVLRANGGIVKRGSVKSHGKAC